MGATGSTLSADLKGKVVAKNLLDAEILNLMGGSSALPDQIPVEQLTNALKNKTDVFLTHNWGPNQDNHKRVAVINEGLKAKGLFTWFDSEKMEGDVKRKMTVGIDNASCVVVFVTQLYIDKVRGDNADDNCRLEFGYSARCKTAIRMVPVVMESGVRNTSGWKGEVGMVLGGLLYVDMCDDITDAKISELYDRILSVNNGVKLTDLFEKCMTLATKHATLPTSSATLQLPSAVSPKPSASRELYDWMTQTVLLAPTAAKTYCNILINSNIVSVDRLMKRYEKNKNLLAELNIDEFDAEDIVKALGTIASSSSATTLEPSKQPETKSVVSTPTPAAEQQQKEQQSFGSRFFSNLFSKSPVVPTQWSEKASWDVGGPVTVVKFSPDGSVIAVAIKDSTRVLLYKPSSKLIRSINEVGVLVLGLSFSPDGTKLATSSYHEFCVRMFKVSSGELLSLAVVNSASRLCFFNNTTLIAAHFNCCLAIDVASGSPTGTVAADGRAGICVSHKGTLYIAGGDLVTIWDNLSSSRLSFDCSDVVSICINSDGSRIVINNSWGGIRVYSDSGLVIGEVAGPGNSHNDINSLSMNATGSCLWF